MQAQATQGLWQALHQPDPRRGGTLGCRLRGKQGTGRAPGGGQGGPGGGQEDRPFSLQLVVGRTPHGAAAAAICRRLARDSGQSGEAVSPTGTKAPSDA